jgi:galactokinase
MNNMFRVTKCNECDVFKGVFCCKEIKQVKLACEALDDGKIEVLGKLIQENEGLSKDYEVSCAE